MDSQVIEGMKKEMDSVETTSGLSIADIECVSQETLDGIYAFAYDFYEKGRLDDAEIFFKFLSIYDFQNPDYLKGYAAVCQLKKDYQRACDLYGIAFGMSNEDDYSPIYLMAQCLLCMKKIQDAQECFKVVIENSEDKILVEKASKYVELINDLFISPEKSEPAIAALDSDI